MSERTTTEVEDCAEKDTKTEKNGETPRGTESSWIRGKVGRKDKRIRKRKVAREKNT